MAYTLFTKCIRKENFEIQTPPDITFHNQIAEIPVINILNVNNPHKFLIFNFSHKYEGLV